ncbi:MAG: hypothetical protein PHD76_00470 [Methylacidiphilales bacterium]|nr:hypothetical protein [Candidatus Methylacidiphilales bacterium]
MDTPATDTKPPALRCGSKASPSLCVLGIVSGLPQNNHDHTGLACGNTVSS